MKNSDPKPNLRKILIVDDTQADHDFLAFLLNRIKKKGEFPDIEVQHAFTGTDGLALVQCSDSLHMMDKVHSAEHFSTHPGTYQKWFAVFLKLKGSHHFCRIPITSCGLRDGCGIKPIIVKMNN